MLVLSVISAICVTLQVFAYDLGGAMTDSTLLLGSLELLNIFNTIPQEMTLIHLAADGSFYFDHFSSNS